MLGLTLTRMAHRSRTSAGNLHRLENDGSLPHMRTLRRVARAYGLPVGMLRVIRDSVFLSRNLARLRCGISTARRELRTASQGSDVYRKRQAEAQRVLRGLRASLDEMQRYH